MVFIVEIFVETANLQATRTVYLRKLLKKSGVKYRYTPPLSESGLWIHPMNIAVAFLFQKDKKNSNSKSLLCFTFQILTSDYLLGFVRISIRYDRRKNPAKQF